MAKFNRYKNPFGRKASKRHVLDDGVTKVAGSWELAVGNWLIAEGIEFEAQPKPAFKYKNPRTGGTHSYTADFYLPAHGIYFEVTPQYALDRAGGQKARKIRRVQQQNPDITLFVLTGDELEDMGILRRPKKRKKKKGETK